MYEFANPVNELNSVPNSAKTMRQHSRKIKDVHVNFFWANAMLLSGILYFALLGKEVVLLSS